MDGSREFRGRDLDEAIEDACSYFNTGRERLEIEIVQDSRSGLFGFIGSRKAIVRARRASLDDALASVLGSLGRTPSGEQENTDSGPARRTDADSGTDSNEGPRKKTSSDGSFVVSGEKRAEQTCFSRGEGETRGEAKAVERRAGARGDRPGGRVTEPVGKTGKAEQPSRERNARRPGDNSRDTARENARPGSGAAQPREQKMRRPADGAGETVQAGRAAAASSRRAARKDDPQAPLREGGRVVRLLLTPLFGVDTDLGTDADHGLLNVRAHVRLDGSEARLAAARDVLDEKSPLLGALHTIALRLLDRCLSQHVRLRLELSFQNGDAFLGSRALSEPPSGRERLIHLAQKLADQVERTGAPATTRPLEPAQRRIIHLALRKMPGIRTRSVGAGEMKRVQVLPAGREEDTPRGGTVKTGEPRGKNAVKAAPRRESAAKATEQTEGTRTEPAPSGRGTDAQGE